MDIPFYTDKQKISFLKHDTSGIQTFPKQYKIIGNIDEGYDMNTYKKMERFDKTMLRQKKYLHEVLKKNRMRSDFKGSKNVMKENYFDEYEIPYKIDGGQLENDDFKDWGFVFNEVDFTLRKNDFVELK
jgi:hypothetical protein